MIRHNGMRPQDIVVLLKIIIAPPGCTNKEIAESLLLSPAEVTYSLQRSAVARLIHPLRRNVALTALLEFIHYGLPYVFPAVKGSVRSGIPTGLSTPVMSPYVTNNQSYPTVVWPYLDGDENGESISPLYPNAVIAAMKDYTLYELLSLIDVMRLGKAKEKEIAHTLLKEKLGSQHT